MENSTKWTHQITGTGFSPRILLRKFAQIFRRVVRCVWRGVS